MTARRPPYIRLPCFLLLASLAAPLFLFVLIGASGLDPGSVHGEGALVALGFFLTLMVSAVFVIFVLVTTWPPGGRAVAGPEPPENFLRTRKGVLATGVYLAVLALIFGSILAQLQVGLNR